MPHSTAPDRRSGCYGEMETLAPEERRARKWRALKALTDHAAEHSGEFRARLARAGLSAAAIRTPEDFARIPPLRKKDIIALQRERGLAHLLTVPVGALRRIYQSPGPILDPEADAPDYWGWAEAFHACGFRPCDVVQVTFGYHLTPAGLMLEEPLREIGCAVVPAGPGNTQVQLDLLRAVGATGFVGMASYLAVIGEKALAAGLDPRTDFRLQVAFVAAERLTDALRARVQEMFGMLVRQGYGTADAGCIAYECPEGAGMHLSSRCWVEICDPATGAPLPDGETGEVVATPFNPAYPLIRLATGDLSAMLPGACPCGRTARRLAGILGRVDDTAKVKGQFLYPSQAAGVMENFPAVARWQLRVANPGGRDRLEVALAVRGGAQALDEAAFRTAFGAVMKLAPALAIYDAATAEAARELPDGAPLLVDARTFE